MADMLPRGLSYHKVKREIYSPGGPCGWFRRRSSFAKRGTKRTPPHLRAPTIRRAAKSGRPRYDPVRRPTVTLRTEAGSRGEKEVVNARGSL